MMPLKMELPSVPRIRKTLIRATIRKAGTLTMPPSHGQAVRAWGSCTPNPSRKTTR